MPLDLREATTRIHRAQVQSYYIPSVVDRSLSFDIRPSGLPVFDQLSESSCTANANMLRLYIHKMRAGFPCPDYSRQYDYFNSRQFLGITTDIGSTGIAALVACGNTGVALEQYDPYDPETVNVPPSAAALADGHTRLVTKWESLQNYDDMRSALAEGLPISYATPVPVEFLGITGTLDEQYYSMIANAPFCFSGKARIGLHELVVTAWKPQYGCYVAQSSWGASYGDGGLVLVPEISMFRDAYEFTVVREFDGTAVVDQFQIQMTAAIVAYLGRQPLTGEIDAWRATHQTINACKWYITTTGEFKARLRTYYPDFYAAVYGNFDPYAPSPPMPATPRGPGDY